MFKKFKPIVLVIVLIALVAIYLIVQYAGSGDRNFKDIVLEFDPAEVTEMLITNPGQPEPTHLVLEGKDWKVIINGTTYTADSNTVRGALAQLSQLNTKRFAGRSKEVARKYELTDSAAVKVSLFSGKKEFATLMVGKFDYVQRPQGMQNPNFGQQQQGEMTTYVKLEDEKEVYVVDGFLKMTVGKNSDGFRDMNIVKVPRKDMTRISFETPEGPALLEKTDGRWTYNGLATDSIKMVRYTTTLSLLTNQDFIYGEVPAVAPSHTMHIEGNNFTPIDILMYPVADSTVQYVVTTSRNPEALFNGKKSGLFDKLLPDPSVAFLPDPEGK